MQIDEHIEHNGGCVAEVTLDGKAATVWWDASGDPADLAAHLDHDDDVVPRENRRVTIAIVSGGEVGESESVTLDRIS